LKGAAELTDIKSQILAEAQHIVSGARRQQYGAPEQNFERIGALWNVWLKLKLSAQLAQGEFADPEASAVRQWLADHTLIDARDVSPLMRLMKEARLLESPAHADSFVDLVGYALTGAEVNGVVLDAPKTIEHRADEAHGPLTYWDNLGEPQQRDWQPVVGERVRVKYGAKTPRGGTTGTVAKEPRRVGPDWHFNVLVQLDQPDCAVYYLAHELEPYDDIETQKASQEAEARARKNEQEATPLSMRAERLWANEKISVAGKDPPVEKGLEVGPARIHVF
jgi:hypothetical protein